MSTVSNMGFFIRIFTTLLGLWVADKLLGGFQVNGGWKGYLIAAIVLALLNLVIRPIIKLVSLPLIILTLGFFSIIVNALMLWLTANLTNYIHYSDLTALLLATLTISTINFVTHWV